jgi:hypothetical protein
MQGVKTTKSKVAIPTRYRRADAAPQRLASPAGAEAQMVVLNWA